MTLSTPVQLDFAQPVAARVRLRQLSEDMPTPSETIQQLRARSNAAIAARDIELVVSLLSPDVTVAVAGGPVLHGRDASRRAFAEQFGEPGFDGYVRTPTEIVVDEKTRRATEQGLWIGRWKTRHGPSEQRGTYAAEWTLSPLGWLIDREVYRKKGEQLR
jgi:ketosteroid isomerase-like protein